MSEPTLNVTTGTIYEMGNWNEHSMPAAYRIVLETFDLVAAEPIGYQIAWAASLGEALRSCERRQAILDREVQGAIFNIVFRTGRYFSGESETS